MIKQLFALIVLSLGIVLASTYLNHAVSYLLVAHEWVSNLLTDVFSGGTTGNLVRNLLALISIPIVAGFLPSVLYWAIKRSFFPYFMQIVWVVWLIQAGALVIYSAST